VERGCLDAGPGNGRDRAATAGIYGAVSFAVNQRTRDLGVRVALGATRIDIIREVVVSGGKPVLQGLIVGLWMSVAAAAGLHNPKLRQFPNYNENISVAKSFPIHEQIRLDFRAEAFNVFNRVRFGAGSRSLQSQSFGRLTSNGDLLNAPRQLQLALKLYYYKLYLSCISAGSNRALLCARHC
jgi:hypothetical protein